MDFRKTFDKIPEEFDKYRPRYCIELFKELINLSDLNSRKSVLEIGPGTGQATEPILETGSDYTAIELGENFTEYMEKKFSRYNNFNIINGDFEVYDFREKKFDLIYSGATIQWIPEKIAFTKAFELLKPGGILAMFMTCSDEENNKKLYREIEEIYKKYFVVKQKYNCKMNYENVVNYGFNKLKKLEWKKKRILNADEYISYISTHCEHITLEEPNKSKFYEGVRQAIIKEGNKIIIYDTIPLYIAQKPI
ncbi:class I SAM-dependent methyltransferase [uncultured Clostridium sp.]|uniref:class I SAM-dependent methyltransferase n=1 Tax=uncultured Clostridium sp. TaxID=59620 RepID=UPI0026045380|nr:class I SAM-dependent methyltransferase [uncultured Clostridium sp.]